MERNVILNSYGNIKDKKHGLSGLYSDDDGENGEIFN